MMRCPEPQKKNAAAGEKLDFEIAVIFSCEAVF